MYDYRVVHVIAICKPQQLIQQEGCQTNVKGHYAMHLKMSSEKLSPLNSLAGQI